MTHHDTVPACPNCGFTVAVRSMGVMTGDDEGVIYVCDQCVFRDPDLDDGEAGSVPFTFAHMADGRIVEMKSL